MVLLLCVFFVFAMLSCLFIAALWSPAGKGASLLALLYVVLSCAFVTFQCGVLGQVWCLIVSIPDICLLTYFYDRFHGYVNNKDAVDVVQVCVRACHCLFQNASSGIMIITGLLKT